MCYGVIMTTAKRPKRSHHAPTIRDELGRKLCRRCDQWLDEEMFSKSKTAGDGLHCYCIRCVNLRKFGLDRNSYDELLAAQGGVCAICKGR